MWRDREPRLAIRVSIDISIILNNWLKYQKDKWWLSLITKSITNYQRIDIVAAAKWGFIEDGRSDSKTNGKCKDHGS